MKTLKFSYFATGEGSVEEIFITNAPNAIEKFFAYKHVTDVRSKEWYEKGIEEFDHIPEFVKNFLSQKAIDEMVRKNINQISFETSFYTHSFI